MIKTVSATESALPLASQSLEIHTTQEVSVTRCEMQEASEHLDPPPENLLHGLVHAIPVASEARAIGLV
jgi:hypothetical protein